MISNQTDNSEKKNYLISVDGSDYSDWGFDMIFNEIYKKGDFITLLHVANTKKISDIPFKFQPDQIISKYETKLIGKVPKNDYILIRRDRSNETHALETVHSVAKSNNADLVVLGCQGHKGVKDKKELSSGITFLIKNINVPSIVVKENSQRLRKEAKGFNWLVCIENHYTRSFKAFELATSLIDKDKDYITALHLYNSYVDNYKETEDAFEKYCTKVGITKRKFVAIEKKTQYSVGKNICDYVNFGDDYIDFVVIGHNISKYSNDINSSPTVDIIKYAQSNILFSSKA